MNSSNARFSSRAVVAPEGVEARLAVVDRDRAEQVLEPVLVERVALDVEEEVALGGRRQEREAAAAPRARAARRTGVAGARAGRAAGAPGGGAFSNVACGDLRHGRVAGRRRRAAATVVMPARARGAAIWCASHAGHEAEVVVGDRAARRSARPSGRARSARPGSGRCRAASAAISARKRCLIRR